MRSLGIVRRDPFNQNQDSNLPSPKNIGMNIRLFYISFSFFIFLEPIYHNYTPSNIEQPNQSSK